VPPLIVAQDLTKRYASGSQTVVAVDAVSFGVAPGEFVALMGPSGCGKSTLLHLCGAMDRPTSGHISLGSLALEALDDDRLTRLRRTTIGFVFQFFNLLPTLTLLENIALPLLLDGKPSGQALTRAEAVAARVGLASRLAHFPHQLSGGELQRGAIARALAPAPQLLVADEPTGSLDSANGDAVLSLIRELNRESGLTVLLATHAPHVADAATRVLHMRDGRFVDGLEESPRAPRGFRGDL
jgi:putative ABC transport system ATP-binding protein